VWYTEFHHLQNLTGFVWCIGRRPCYGLAAFALTREKIAMDVDVFVGNLSNSTTAEDLISLFRVAGEVVSVNIMTNPKSGEARCFAFITMSAQNEADKAVSMFNSYLLDEHFLKVFLARPRVQRGLES
jgi:RNA recognition motif-containing protein